MRLNPHARTEHGRQCCGGVVKLLLEPLAVRPVVALFGVGHVGYELARILSRLPIQLLLIDSRAEQLDRVRLADVIDGTAEVGIYHTLLGEQVLEQLPRGAHVLIMTHDHAEDYALCDAALRLNQPLGGIGLIGSAAKWTRFQAQLAAAGHSPEAIARITCPIGQPGITGKDPAVIAVAVASALLPMLERQARAAGGDAMTLYAGTIVDTPGDPFTGDPDDALAQTGALLVREGVIRARGSFADAAGRAPGRAGHPARRRAAGPRLRRQPRALPADPRDRRAGHAAARLAGAMRPARGEQARRPGVRARGGRGVPRRAARVGHDQRAGVRLALRPGHGRAVRRGRAARPEHHLGPGAQRPDPASGPAQLAGDGADRQRGPDPALA